MPSCEHIDKLYEWRSLVDLADVYDAMRKNIEAERFFGFKLVKLREAFVARKFLQSLKENSMVPRFEVRLKRDGDNPDFEVIFEDGTTVPYEISEILDNERKRNDEYKTGGLLNNGSEDAITQQERLWHQPVTEHVLSQIKRTLDKKLEKKYPDSTEIIFFMNLQGSMFLEREYLFEAIDGSDVFANCRFRRVWLLYDEGALRIFSPP